ncbi:MAG: ROK family protein [Polyangiaceae bacterium]|nr:ROK family protein [Polyangiaceae bacterium]
MGYAFRKAILLDNRESILPDLLEGASLDNVRSSILKRCWDEGDVVVRETLMEAARYLGIAAGNLITMLAPHTIVLGGGVCDALGEELLEVIQKNAKAHTFPHRSFEDTSIELAQLGDDAVALGAFEFARDRFQSESQED